VKRAARAVALLAALGAGFLLFGARGKEVVLVYDLSAAPEATGLEVEIRREATLVRRAAFRVAGGEQVRHVVKLREGEYALAWRLTGPEGGGAGERPLSIEEEGTIVLPLSRRP
jgi:hypothetical protein